MSRAIAMKKIISSIHKGIERAHTNYEKASGGDWLWRAPEYYSTTYVFDEIAKNLYGETLRLEMKPIEVLEHSGGIGKGTLSKRMQRGRIDIVLNYSTPINEPKPRGIIELKKQAYSIEQISSDLKRIREALIRGKGGNSLQFGTCSFFLSYTENHKTPKMDKCIRKLKDDLANYPFPDNVKASLFHGEIHNVKKEESSWCVITIFIQKTK